MMEESRRSAIAGRAASLFDQHGYHQTTMEDIAVAVGIKKPTLYHYVSSKEEILLLIHEEFVTLLFDAQKQRVGLGYRYDEMLRETIRDLIRLMGSHRSHVRVFFEHYRELSVPNQELVRPKREEYFQLVVGYIQAGINAGHYKVVSADLAALAMFGMCNWAYTWFRVDGDFTEVEVADNFWSWLTAGFASGDQMPTAVSVGEHHKI